jgi:hypothetical protein
MQWDQSDSSRFRAYDKQTNGKLRAFLRSRMPAIEGKNIEEYALQASYKEGCEFMLQQLDDIITDENKPDDASSASFTSM